MTLHLLPNLLGDQLDHRLFLPSTVDAAVSALDGLIAESAVGGLRYLKRFQTKRPPNQIPVALITEEVNFLLEPVLKGEQWGFVSDAGLPALADPGAKLVRRAQMLKIPIKIYPGPSSITMALILSGLSGQRFTFHGYLSKDPKTRKEQLKKCEKEEGTQIFIEAPYRNQHTFEACLEVLRPDTLLCVARELTLPTEFVRTDFIKKWKDFPIQIGKVPTIFLISGS